MHTTSPIPGLDLFEYRVPLLSNEVEVFFGVVPDNLEDFVFATQAVQAEAMKFIIERFRTQMWRRTGILWWNIIDGWPQFSDAVVDYYFEKKLAYEFIERAQKPVCLAIREEADGSLLLVGVNDSRENIHLKYSVSDVESKQTVLEGEVVASPNSATPVAKVPSGNQGMYRISWDSEIGSETSHFVFGKTPYDLGAYKEMLQENYRAVGAVQKGVS
jgi:beta-mannosidase